ncbi:hypothetical protein SM996_00025, partial [Escherichia coli]|nr:hypothetical protein [Escherichia coli]
RSHWSTSKTPSYTKSVSWQHHQGNREIYRNLARRLNGGVLPYSTYDRLSEVDLGAIGFALCMKFSECSVLWLFFISYGGKMKE